MTRMSCVGENALNGASIRGEQVWATTTTTTTTSMNTNIPGVSSTSVRKYTPAPHQVAGHLFECGKMGSLVCDSGYFYKPLQSAQRGMRERAFYELLNGERAFFDLFSDEKDGEKEEGTLLRDLCRFVPKFYGVIELGEHFYMKMEDVTRQFVQPCIMDIKIGYQTWYSSATDSHIRKCKLKDSATTTSELGFKICGMQTFNMESGDNWRATKEWCKQLNVRSVKSSLRRFFSHSSTNLNAKSICLGPAGLVRRMEELQKWFERQQHFHFYSASLLIIYEGCATTPEELKVDMRLIDFAHALRVNGERDENFISGLSSLKHVLRDIANESVKLVSE